MRRNLFLIAVFLLVTGVGLTFMTLNSRAAASAEQQAIAAQIIARERASYDAWKRKDKAFYADFMADDATYFGPHTPYLEVEPKVNLLPKFEQYAEMFKYTDFQMYNPRVQVYGDTAILTYNSQVTATVNGQPFSYTGKMTTVYVKQGDTWRVVHGHESMNPAAR
jgi:ketosteroid isomerase-like protein